MRWRVKLLLPLLLCFIAGQSANSQGMVPLIRVGLVRHAASVPFQPSGSATVALGGERALAIPAGETWTARAEAPGIVLARADGAEAGRFSSALRITVPEPGTITVGGVEGHWDGRTERAYRGAIEIRPDGAGGLTAINVVDLETYLRGVVPSEMPPEYPRAALQAQAVAARGQALMKAFRHADEGFGPCSTQHCQVYGGASSEDPRTDDAVASTRGEVVMYQGRLADTLYSSDCGGHTTNNEDYWPAQAPVPYLRGVPDFEPEDKVPYQFPIPEREIGSYLKYAPGVNCNRPQYAATDKIRWWEVVPSEQLEADLRERLGDSGTLLGVRVLARAESGVVTRLLVVGTKRTRRVLGGAEARRVLGVKSPSFFVDLVLGRDGIPVAFVIWGAGWGHQVGMCQVGAAGLADKGWDYRRILAKYYAGTEVEKRY
jgi:stage II sporulation protein D